MSHGEDCHWTQAVTKYVIRKRNDAVRDTCKSRTGHMEDCQCWAQVKTYINYSVMSAVLNNKGIDELKPRAIQVHSINP